MVDNPDRLPELLIIGAMKSGTTTLYMQLAERTRVYLAENKEPHWLTKDEVLTPEGKARYAGVYRNARPDELLCDASTGYTKLPQHTAVVERALKVLPDGFRVVYLVRNPVERALSHFRHEFVAGSASDKIDDEVRNSENYLNFSRYAMQLRPWLEALGRERVRVVTFERFVANQEEVLSELAEFAGVELQTASGIPAKAYNQSKNKPRRNALWDAIYNSKVYRRLIRPNLPVGLRLRLFKLLLPKTDPSGLKPKDETLDWLREQLAPDAAELAEMLGAEPLWPELASLAPPPETVSD